MSTFTFSPAPTTTGTSPELPLPRGLRAEAEQMTMTGFWNTYSPTSGPIELGSWSASAPLAGRRRYDFSVDIRGTRQTSTARAYGPVEAMTESLHKAGLPIEIGEFHQQLTEAGWASYITCRYHDRTVWAAGVGRDGTEATLRAMIAGANRLHGSRF
ncbi:alpha-isopropylmalate synthase regulatory domain-containing protein [Millisia brevis]|uniref:alpha-isopropylmalate synthase regulatory domain-containing protein n=1 Tax=Millisia brevis TaxID=264148 RepID=UPI00082B3594|nr:alpha-isopropylmalate synthase regulatory domain-containing protein [Millisia brevis]